VTVVHAAAEAVADAGTPWWVLLIVAGMAAVASIIAAFIGRQNRRENKSDHGRVIDRLDNMTDATHDVAAAVHDLDKRTDASLRRLHDRIDGHLEWHAGHPGTTDDTEWDGAERRREPRHGD
jgi:hypothetical protein